MKAEALQNHLFIPERVEAARPIIEDEQQQQPTTPFALAQSSVQQEFLPPPLLPKFAHKKILKGANESEGSSHTGMGSQAIPTFASTTPPKGASHLQPQPFLGALPSSPLHLWVLGQLPGKNCNPQIRSWITTPVQQVQGEATHLFCRCIFLQVWVTHRLLLLLPTLAQQWEQPARHHKLEHNKVG